jgi:dienelactone hydrolase
MLIMSRTFLSFIPAVEEAAMSLGPVTRRTALKWSATALAAAATSSNVRIVRADAPRVLAAGQVAKDRRLGNLKDLHGYFPWTPSASLAEWEHRAEYVRRQVLVACGLWPMPARPPIQATIHGKVDRDDYAVEKVYFESHPGLYVTGSLYRPKGRNGKRPAVICPHGHWANGRFHDHGEAKVKQEIEKEAEQFAVGGRHPLQARCVQLARMGYVAFLYDMLGVADNTILPGSLIHQFGKQRPEMSQPDHWGLFSAQSELRCLNALGLQTWNSIRVLDWITTLPDVDAEKIGVTGASGGGTQTFLLGAVDPRPKALFPAVMVSTAMQGGCTCENASYLRVNTGNIELAALIAPRHLGLSAANDWTKEIETKGLPDLTKHYEQLGVPDRVQGKYFDFEHNYNHHSRMMMYAFMHSALGNGAQQIVERDFVPLKKEEASVWDDQHPFPGTGEEAELKLLRAFATEFDRQLTALTPKDAASLAEYRRVIGGGWDILVGRNLKTTGEVEHENHITDEQKSGYKQTTGWIRNKTHGEEIPSLFLLPENWNRRVVLWLTDTGKAGLLDAGGSLIPGVAQLVQHGTAVLGIDLLYQGEFLADGQPLAETRRVNNNREFLGYTVGYNHPLFSQRVHDVLSVVVAARTHRTPPESLDLVGIGQAGVIAAAGAVAAGDAVRKLAVHIGGFQFGSITNVRDPMLVPGAVRYGDVAGLLALRAPQPLWLGESVPPLTAAAFRAGSPGAIASANVTVDNAGVGAAKWLMS